MYMYTAMNRGRTGVEIRLDLRPGFIVVSNYAMNINNTKHK